MMVVDGGAKGGMISASAAKANSRQSDFRYDINLQETYLLLYCEMCWEYVLALPMILRIQSRLV